ncbi:response regulator transcription factor [Pseudoduganella violacea]|uniref:DNA-binding response OmpR family regulator n=1 Tax=Pseudoduganella violacea TaxID=1715466 RepID=A0A7W5BCV8_9BURK|nr:response regulator transcription factor [Pseudoduganella violacea]MBB3120882.1 DNA-binding response OmpR family regulator [Pseudoduganella violacea]
MRVLLVEDDAVLADGLARVLRGHGMAVELLRSGSEADAALLRPDAAEVVVLDIGLPGLDGLEVLRRLRARAGAVPVLLLTARDAIEDRVRGLELGADDYLVKPFATPELVARLKALARRNVPQPAVLGLGSLTLDTQAKRARVGERVIDLSVREWAVLEYLFLHSARVVSKQQIIDAILPWGEDVTTNAVEVYISRVRQKTADAGISIRTIRGFGYMLEASAAADGHA